MTDEERSEEVEGKETEDTGDGGQDGSEPETFPKEYVERLRQEAAEHRKRAEHADALKRSLLDVAIREATAGILEDPDDIHRSGHEPAEWDGDDGLPDPAKIKAAAEELVSAKPHLAKRKGPQGDVGQGPRDEQADPTETFARALRSAAG